MSARRAARAPRVRRCFPTLLLAALALANAAQAASPPGVLVVAQSLDDLLSLDPAEGFELSGMQAINNVYQRLVQPDPDHPETLAPTLAASWSTGSSLRSLVFELRADAQFANGHPVRPEDVIFSLSRAVKMNRAPVFILNELGWSAATVDAALVKVDARHVEIRWSAQIGPALALSILTAPVASILDEVEVRSHAAATDGGPEAVGNTWLKSHSAGSGPFQIRRYLAHEALVLDVNANVSPPVPSLKTIVIKNVADAATRRLLVDVGDADMARDLGPDQIAALAGRPRLKTLEFPSATIQYLLLNTASGRNPALKNPALWEAVRWLIDYQGIAANLLKGEYQVHQAFLASGFRGALDDTPYHLDIPKARAILKNAGLDGLVVELDVFNQPPYGDIAQSLQATFAAAGIRLEVLPGLSGEVYAKLRARTGQAAWLYWVPDYYDANSSASAFALNRDDGTKTLAWRAGWHIPDLSARTQAAALEENPDARITDYRAIQAEVQHSAPLVVAFQAKNKLVVRSNVNGYRQGMDAEMVYYAGVSK